MKIILYYQKRYLQSLLERFEMKDCKPKYTPSDSNINNICSEISYEKLYREIVGSLIYAMTATRSDLCFIVTKLLQFMSKPYVEHMMLVKHVLRYI